MELEGAFAAPSTAQSPSESTATLGRKSSGSGGNDDLNVPALRPISELLDRRPLAAPATFSGIERGRQEMKERSNRSSSSKPSFTPVVVKTITKSPATGRSIDGKGRVNPLDRTADPSKDQRGSRFQEGLMIRTPKRLLSNLLLKSAPDRVPTRCPFLTVGSVGLIPTKLNTAMSLTRST